MRRYAHLFSFFLYLSPPLSLVAGIIYCLRHVLREILQKKTRAQISGGLLIVFLPRKRGIKPLSFENSFPARPFKSKAFLSFIYFLYYFQRCENFSLSSVLQSAETARRYFNSAPQFTLNSPFFRPIFILWRFRAVLVANSRGAHRIFFFFSIFFFLSPNEKREKTQDAQRYFFNFFARYCGL